jgi:transposase
MPTQKSIDYKETAVNYYLVEDKTQEEVCKIFNCSRRSLMRWVQKYKNIKIKEKLLVMKEHQRHIKFVKNMFLFYWNK